MKSYVVLGAAFGDEGKGRVVDALCASDPNASVVRFSGGPQAAHNVVMSEWVSHVFSHFGSGTLRGAMTYWLKYCPVDPVVLFWEYRQLKTMGFKPVICIDRKCPVITPFEIRWSKGSARLNRDGTCGMGIYATHKRESDHRHILFEDLFHPVALRIKIDELVDYYGFGIDGDLLYEFYRTCEHVVCAADIMVMNHKYPIRGDTVVYEGSQGLLLDQNYGFFPHVTPANTGMTNLLDAGIEGDPEIYLVTRAYQTRHGVGPMSKMVKDHRIRPNPYEMNKDDGSQGKFRRTLLDLDMLKYAVEKDDYIRRNPRTLVITCLDLVENEYRLLSGGRAIDCVSKREFIDMIHYAVGASKVLLSRSPIGDLEEY